MYAIAAHEQISRCSNISNIYQAFMCLWTIEIEMLISTFSMDRKDSYLKVLCAWFGGWKGFKTFSTLREKASL